MCTKCSPSNVILSGSNEVLSKNLPSYGSFGTFTLPQNGGAYFGSFKIGSMPSTSMPFVPISISSRSSSSSRSTTLPFSYTMGLSFFWCFLSDSRINCVTFYLPFFVLGPSLVSVGLGLGDLGDFSTSMGISTLMMFEDYT